MRLVEEDWAGRMGGAVGKRLLRAATRPIRPLLGAMLAAAAAGRRRRLPLLASQSLRRFPAFRRSPSAPS